MAHFTRYSLNGAVTQILLDAMFSCQIYVYAK